MNESKLTKQELIDLIDDVNATVSAILSQHLVLMEELTGGRSETTRKRIELLKMKLTAARVKLGADIKADQVQKKAAELKKEGISRTDAPIPIKKSGGAVVGWIKRNGREYQVWNSHGRLLFRIG